ncbi:hypothetical protein ACL02T_30130 [Pseudonocardia sp. RS010]|uniref:hypothetical protein n=1 Tax=Pseudonocardia sp. RS010 TaxID=3385979 RepID=UPI0039A11CBF
MTITYVSEETTQDILRQALGLAPKRAYLWNGQDLLAPCQECGHHPIFEEPASLPAGDPVVDVVQDQAALQEAARTVAMLVDVLDQRRSPRQMRDLVNPRVLRYMHAAPADATGSRGVTSRSSVRSRPPAPGLTSSVPLSAATLRRRAGPPGRARRSMRASGRDGTRRLHRVVRRW